MTANDFLKLLQERKDGWKETIRLLGTEETQGRFDIEQRIEELEILEKIIEERQAKALELASQKLNIEHE